MRHQRCRTQYCYTTGKRLRWTRQLRSQEDTRLLSKATAKKPQAISFQIISTNSNSIQVGMVLPDILLKNTSYFLQQTDLKHGLFCLSALGVSYQHNNPEKQDSQDTFIFGPGDVIDINWDPKTKKLDFSRRHTRQKATLYINLQGS